MALDMIRAGRADMVVAGGAEAVIHPLPIAAFATMRALVDPQRRAGVRPLVRTTRAATGSSWVKVRASSSSSARPTPMPAAPRSTACSPAAACRPTRTMSSPRSRPVPERPGHWRWRCATPALQPRTSPTSTPTRPRPRMGDVAEALAMRKALGSAMDSVVVSATKGCTGHLLGAAGAVEAIATLLALRDRLAPPTRNLDDPDDASTSMSPGSIRGRCVRGRSPRCRTPSASAGTTFLSSSGVTDMTALAASPKSDLTVAPPRDPSEVSDPRDPMVRIERLGEITEVLNDDDGVVVAALVADGVPMIAFATDPRRQGGAMGTKGCEALCSGVRGGHRARLPGRRHLAQRRRPADRRRRLAARRRQGLRGHDAGERQDPAAVAGARPGGRRCRLRPGAHRRRDHGSGGPHLRHRPGRRAQRHR